MGRHSSSYKQRLKKGLWSPEEDDKLIKHITEFGHGCWSSVPKLAGLQRCGKSCRLRWINYLRPDLKRGTFSQQEEALIIELHAHLGNKWSQIAAQLPGRTDNEIKNLWNSSIKKKLKQKGIDPDTHKPISDVQNEYKPSFGSSINNQQTFAGMENSPLDTHQFFRNRFTTSHPNATIEANAKNTNSDNYSGFADFNYTKPPLDSGPLFASNSIPTSNSHAKTSSLIPEFTSVSTSVHYGFCNNNWENTSLFDANNGFQWGLTNCELYENNQEDVDTYKKQLQRLAESYGQFT